MQRLTTGLGAALRRPAAALAAVALTAVAGYGAWVGFVSLAVGHHRREAVRALDRQDATAALDHLDAALRWRPRDGGLLLLAAKAARRDGDLVNAERLLELGGKQSPLPDGLGVERALLRVQDGDLRSAEPGLLARLQQEPPETAEILEVLVPAYLKGFELDSAYRWLEYWLKRDPNNGRAQLWMSDVAERLGNPQVALESARAAAVADPDSEAAHRQCGRLLLRARHPEEALRHYEWLLANRADDGSARVGLAHCRREMGEYGEAARLLDEALRADPRDAAALAERGFVDLDVGRPREALSRLHDAAARTPSDPDLLYRYALCLEQCGRSDEARRARDRLDRCHADLDRLKELLTAIRRDTHNPALRLQAGEILLRNDQGAEGMHWLESALREDPGYAPARKAMEEYASRGAKKPTPDQGGP